MVEIVSRRSQLVDIKHVIVDYAPDRYAGHPRQGGIFNYGNGEIAVLYHRAPCDYKLETDVLHDYGGYHSRSQVIMARSFDNGKSWNRADDVVVFDETAPIEERRAWVRQVNTELGRAVDALHLDTPIAKRQQIDLRDPDSSIYFGRTYAGEGDPPSMLTFAIRSADRGQHWEAVPTPVQPPRGHKHVHKDGHPLVQMPDGTHLAAMTAGGGITLYGSDDNGLRWVPLSRIAWDPTSEGRSTYAALLRLPSGRLQCYMLNINGLRDAIQMNYSDDGGYSWSQPKPIVRWGQSPWAAQARVDEHSQRWNVGIYYRSPWPLRMADGRIIVLFTRRKPPYGLGVLISEDEGASWSSDQILRDDGSIPDIGYPVATEIAPGRIFTAYYYALDDKNGYGGTRFIAGSSFTCK